MSSRTLILGAALFANVCHASIWAGNPPGGQPEVSTTCAVLGWISPDLVALLEAWETLSCEGGG